MATKFEFLPRPNRRLPLDWRLPGVFVILLLASLWLSWNLRESSNELKSRFDREVEAIENRRQELVSQAWKLIPDPSAVAKIHQAIEKHNFSLIGAQPLWSELFQIFEEDLPPTAVIAKIENPRSNTTAFASTENDFRLQVVVADIETSNLLFSKLSSRKALQSLSFTPKGDASHQGRKGIGIEITFHMEKTS